MFAARRRHAEKVLTVSCRPDLKPKQLVAVVSVELFLFHWQDRSVLRKSERTRQSILDAALKFLWTHPFRDLTVAELMSLAGTSRSAFYHFEDLHGLMEALLQAIEEDIFDVVTPWLQGAIRFASSMI